MSPVPILSQINPVQASPHHPISLRSINFNIILPSMPRSSEWCLSLKLHTRILYVPPLVLMHTICHAHLILLDLIAHVWRGVLIMKLLIIQFSPFPGYLIPLRLKYVPHALFQTPSTSVPPTMCETKFHAHCCKSQLHII